MNSGSRSAPPARPFDNVDPGQAHAEGALWQWGLDVEVLDPPDLRVALRVRAAAVAAHHS